MKPMLIDELRIGQLIIYHNKIRDRRVVIQLVTTSQPTR